MNLRKAIVIVGAMFAIEAGIVAVGTGAVHADDHVSAGLNYSAQRVCSTPTTGDAQGERLCATVRKYDRSTFAGREGRAGLEYVETEAAPQCVRYLGWSSIDLSNGHTYVTMESIKSIEDQLPGHAYRFHIYKIIDSKRCQVAYLR